MDELILVYRDSTVESGPAGPAPAVAPRGTAERLAEEVGATLAPIFSEPAIFAEAHHPEAREASRYASAVMPAAEAETLAAKLRALPDVETVYVRLQPENPIAPYDERDHAAWQLAADIGAPAAPPDFRQRQGYLGPSPSGVDAAAAWNKPGGRGEGVRLLDIEGGWCLTHVDLQPNDGLLGGSGLPGSLWRDHGSAVLGVLAATENSQGVSGIAPGARKGCVSHGGIGAGRAIDAATSLLTPGDIMLLEMHDAGPRFGFTRRDDQRGYIAMEWWPDIYLAVRRAIGKGIVVVEAAGNGPEDLDDAFYDSPHSDFPANWRNPFRGERDSGAILVGAGAPPSGVFGPDRSRLGFSNYGSRVDCQGWGRSVATTGYGDLYQGSGEDEWFTAAFSGTSSATPIVAGAIACLQGAVRERGAILTPDHIRELLRMTGTPQQVGVSAPLDQRIGSRPDLAALLTAIGF